MIFYRTYNDFRIITGVISMKKVITLLLISMVLLTSCFAKKDTGVTAVGSVTSESDTNFFAKHEKLSGKREYAIKAETPLEVKAEFVTEEGELGLSIGMEGKEQAYEGHGLQTGTFTVYLNEPGTYQVIVTAEGHKGSYSLSWKEKKE